MKLDDKVLLKKTAEVYYINDTSNRWGFHELIGISKTPETSTVKYVSTDEIIPYSDVDLIKLRVELEQLEKQKQKELLVKQQQERQALLWKNRRRFITNICLAVVIGVVILTILCGFGCWVLLGLGCETIVSAIAWWVATLFFGAVLIIDIIKGVEINVYY